MAASVDEHAVDRNAQIGAAIEVEATHIELVGLTLSAVLADD